MFSDGNCTVKDLEFDSNQLLFGLTNGPSGMPHVYTTNGALHFAQSNGLVSTCNNSTVSLYGPRQVKNCL